MPEPAIQLNLQNFLIDLTIVVSNRFNQYYNHDSAREGW